MKHPLENARHANPAPKREPVHQLTPSAPKVTEVTPLREASDQQLDALTRSIDTRKRVENGWYCFCTISFRKIHACKVVENGMLKHYGWFDWDEVVQFIETGYIHDRLR